MATPRWKEIAGNSLQYDVSAETAKLLADARSAERRSNEPHPTQLSAIGAAISALVGPSASLAPIATRAALDDAQAEPPARSAPAIPFYDVHARLREAREFDRQEAIETARLVELARLSAGDEHEARKGAAAIASSTPQPAAEPADAERRLAALRALGGKAQYLQGSWDFTKIGALVKQEKAEGRARISEKTIRQDLRQAAEAEREAQRQGASPGWLPLGSR